MSQEPRSSQDQSDNLEKFEQKMSLAATYVGDDTKKVKLKKTVIELNSLLVSICDGGEAMFDDIFNESVLPHMLLAAEGNGEHMYTPIHDKHKIIIALYNKLGLHTTPTEEVINLQLNKKQLKKLAKEIARSTESLDTKDAQDKKPTSGKIDAGLKAVDTFYKLLGELTHLLENQSKQVTEPQTDSIDAAAKNLWEAYKEVKESKGLILDPIPEQILELLIQRAFEATDLSGMNPSQLLTILDSFLPEAAITTQAGYEGNPTAGQNTAATGETTDVAATGDTPDAGASWWSCC